MRRLLASLALAAAAVVGGPAAASADHDGCQGGGCGNEREESYEGAGCKYVCPSFDKSPVQDSFNVAPVICLPGSTCHVEKGEQP